jgi:GMP synthase-like glutamine amidotransferase
MVGVAAPCPGRPPPPPATLASPPSPSPTPHTAHPTPAAETLITRWLERGLAAYRAHHPHAAPVHLAEVVAFDCVAGALPALPATPTTDDTPTPGRWDGYVISGSKHTAGEDVPWINALAAYLALVYQQVPGTRLFGICFGHQLLARALGGRVARNERGWEVGVADWAVAQAAQEGETHRFWDQPGQTHVSLQSMHRDMVTALPPSTDTDRFHSLGGNGLCAIQGMRNDRRTLLTVQGHPEFVPGVVREIIGARLASGVFQPEQAAAWLQGEGELEAGVRRPLDDVWLGRKVIALFLGER